MTGKELVIDFAVDGSVTAMHMDTFDLGFLGDKRIERATDIRFDETMQLWGLYLPVDGDWVEVQPGFRFNTYETARSFEIAWLNICRCHNLLPEEPTGVGVLATLFAQHLLDPEAPPLTIEQFSNL